MNKISIFSIIGIGILLASIYLILSFSGAGILVSCGTQKIIEIRNLPPPLASVYQPVFCNVNITVFNLDGTLVCQTSGKVFNSEKGIIECKGIKNEKGKEVNINAQFFDINNILIGQDITKLEVNP